MAVLNVLNIRRSMTPRILIIAGSDSGGGAGIQADIKTVTMLGGHAMTAITAVTAQNTLGVQAVHSVPTDIVVAQMRSCIDDIGIDAIKIGMIGSAETAHAVADVLATLSPSPSGEGLGWGLSAGTGIRGTAPPPTPPLRGRGLSIPIVFDPVMVATSGSALADAETIAAFTRLMALATIVTPNLPEAHALGGVDAIRVHGCHVLLKGGHGEGHRIIDELITADGDHRCWEGKRIDTDETHGTGCTLASAIATGLGEGRDLDESIARAIRFIRIALTSAPGLGQGTGPIGHALGVSPFDELEG